MAGSYKKYWEMRQGPPGSDGQEIFKCTDCGGETEHNAGHNGEPDQGNCFSHCKSKESDWRPGNSSDRYKKNFADTFPDSPGAGW